MRFNSVDDLLNYNKKLEKNIKKGIPTITVCRGTGCTAFGSEELIKEFQKEISKKGLGSKIMVKRTGCHGFCERGPIVLILPEEIFYNQVNKSDVKDIVRGVLNNKVVSRLLYFDINQNKRAEHVMDIPFYKKQVRCVLKNNGRIDPESIDDYISDGGYMVLAKALRDLTPDGIIQEVKKSGLRGRGGAGFPTGLKWEFARKAKGDKKYIICNADEGDPGAFMDRSVLEGNPHSVLEGMLIAGFAIGADEGFIYVRAEYPLAVERLKIAILDCRKMGLLGENILGSNFSIDIKIKEGAGAFVCGEETALIASIEGKRGMPALRPPFPVNSGLWGKPTCINNVETLANIPIIISSGGEAYSKVGTENSKGTKIFSLTGKINNTGLVEVPIGTSLREVIFDIGGGVPKGRRFKAAQMGGPSGGCIPAQYLDLPIDYNTLEAVGAIMGSGGLIVIDDNTCVVDLARFFMNFVREESCGKCVPCRIGTTRMFEILTRISEGRGELSDIDRLLDMGQTIKDASLCGLGRSAPNPVLSTIRYFRHEYESHIKEKRCNASVCKGLVTSPCQHRCPIYEDARGYVSLIAEKRFKEAAEVIRHNNPLPRTCSRICYHPCEERCRRGDIDEPISILGLKRFTMDYGLPKKHEKPILNKRDEKAAIIGSGPAGLSCAKMLALSGYRATIFESMPVAGGMLAAAIPKYRLPRESLKKDINDIVNLGVQLKLNTRVDSIHGLFESGFKAVFVAAGATLGAKLEIPGVDLDGVWEGLKFLKEFNSGKPLKLGGSVAVIGGGNVAMDVARSALRLGPKEVMVLYRRTKDEMPALKTEAHEAEMEGVQFNYLISPSEIIGENGRVTGVKCLRMELGEADKTGRRKPVPVKGSEFVIKIDTLIYALGQYPDLSFLNDENLKKGNLLKVNPYNLSTDIKGVFAGGDCVTGPATMVEAMAAGKRAAKSIGLYLSGKLTSDVFLSPVFRKEGITKSEASEEEKKRVPMPTISLKSRNSGKFKEVEKGFTEKLAVEEASRCLRCGIEE